MTISQRHTFSLSDDYFYYCFAQQWVDGTYTHHSMQEQNDAKAIFLSLSSSPAPLLVQMENPLNKIMCLIFRPVQMEFVRPRHYLYAIFFMMLACQWQWVFGIVCGCGLWMALYWCICDIRYVRTHHSTDIDWGPGHCLSWKWNIRILLLFGGWERAQQCCLRVPIY